MRSYMCLQEHSGVWWQVNRNGLNLLVQHSASALQSFWSFGTSAAPYLCQFRADRLQLT